MATDYDKVRDYYHAQTDANLAKGNPIDDDHDKDSIIVSVFNDAWVFHSPTPRAGKTKSVFFKGSGWFESINEYLETPSIFNKSDKATRQEYLDKKKENKMSRNNGTASDAKANKTYNNQARGRANQQTTEKEKDEITFMEFLTGELENVNETANTLIDGYFGSITEVPDAAPVITVNTPAATDTSMEAWSTQEIALAGGAIAVAIGVIYLIAKK